MLQLKTMPVSPQSFFVEYLFGQQQKKKITPYYLKKGTAPSLQQNDHPPPSTLQAKFKYLKKCSQVEPRRLHSGCHKKTSKTFAHKMFFEFPQKVPPPKTQSGLVPSEAWIGNPA